MIGISTYIMIMTITLILIMLPIFFVAKAVELWTGTVAGAAIATPAAEVWKNGPDTTTNRVGAKNNLDPYLNGIVVGSDVLSRETYLLLQIGREGSGTIHKRVYYPTILNDAPQFQGSMLGGGYIPVNIQMKDGDTLLASAVDVAATALVSIGAFVSYGGPATPFNPLTYRGPTKTLPWTVGTAADCSTSWATTGIRQFSQGEAYPNLKEHRLWDIVGGFMIPEDKQGLGVRLTTGFIVEKGLQVDGIGLPCMNGMLPIKIGTIDNKSAKTIQGVVQAACELEGSFILVPG